jgi:very-short-patch-repair endonuclease
MTSGAVLGIVVVLVVLAVGALIRVSSNLVSSKMTPAPTFPYQRETHLVSPAERSFLGVLEQAVGDQYRVMGKVRLADVIKVRFGMNGKGRQSAFNRIQSKHVDFVVCTAKDLAVQYVVELDDKSHERATRQGRDEFVDQALQAAGVPIFHFSAKRSYAVMDVQKVLAAKEALPDHEAWPAPLDDKQM